MNVNLFVFIVFVISLILGIVIGIQYFKFYNRKINKKIIENAQEVLAGRRDNKIKIDGEEYDAVKFVLRDEKGKKIIIYMKGGGEIQEDEESSKEDVAVNESRTDTDVSENSVSVRKNKRIIGKRFGRS